MLHMKQSSHGHESWIMGSDYRARIGEDEGEAARDPEPKQARTFAELTK